MPLEPSIVAKFWIAKWDENTTNHEKELISWVDDLFYSAMEHDADYSFQLIEAIHDADSAQRFTEVFAAGPIEELLVHHGLEVIERILTKARKDPSFAHVLGGVWKNSMSEDVWEALKQARSTNSWADARN